MFSPTTPNRPGSLERGVGRGRMASTGSQPPPGWALGFEVAIRSTDHKMFLKTLPPPHSDSSVLVVFSLETQLQHCWDWLAITWLGRARSTWSRQERLSAPPPPCPHPTPPPPPAPARRHRSTSLCFLPQKVMASSG